MYTHKSLAQPRSQLDNAIIGQHDHVNAAQD
jgi:hypothetical protein